VPEQQLSTLSGRIRFQEADIQRVGQRRPLAGVCCTEWLGLPARLLDSDIDFLPLRGRHGLQPKLLLTRVLGLVGKPLLKSL